MTHDALNFPVPAAERIETVAAVVVTCNRRELLAQCLDALLAQTRPVDAIYVIDNASTDGTSEMIAKRYTGRIIYERLPENTGGAGGFHHGIKRAYEAGYDWIWAMDDDCIPSHHALKTLVSHINRSATLRPAPTTIEHDTAQSNTNEGATAHPTPLLGCTTPNVGFLAPLVMAADGSYEIYHHKRFRSYPFVHQIRTDSWLKRDLPRSDACLIEGNGFVGPLINRSAIQKVGLPNPRYFITWDDTEFTYRITRCYSAFLIPKAIVTHLDAIRGIAAKTAIPPWRFYYHWRNRILLSRCVDSRVGTLLTVLFVMVHGLLGNLLKRRSLMTFNRALAMAIADGVRGLDGKRYH